MSDWLTVSPLSGQNDYTLTVTASANTGYDKRNTIIIARNNEYNLSTSCFVTQDYNITFDKERLYFEAGYVDSTGLTDTLTIISNGAWTVTDLPSWITLSQYSGGAGTTTITVIAQPNLGYIRGSGIVFSTGNVSVTIPVEQGYESYIKYTTSTGVIAEPNSGVKYNVKFGDYCYAYMSTKDIATNNMYEGNTDITSLDIHNISFIQIYAFFNCSNVTAITLDEQLTTIGNCAFGRIGTLDELVLPASLTGVTSGRWFENSTINKLTVGCNLNGSTQHTVYSLNSARQTAYTESVLGAGMIVNTVEMLSGSSAGFYSLAFSGLSTIIVHSGADFARGYDGIYKNKLVIKDESGTQTRTVYQIMPNDTGVIFMPTGVEWAKPTNNWTIQYTDA